MQAGADPEDWALLLLKELIDNSLDACEADGIAPDIRVRIDADGFSVADNGPGIPPKVVARSLDYSVRVSDKAARVSPTRGQLGNALKLCYAAPFVLEDEARLTITARGVRHEITVGLDRIQQAPVFDHEQHREPATVGTTVRIDSSQLAGQLLENPDGFYHVGPTELADRIVAFNPHATIRVTVGDCAEYRARGTNPAFSKWHIGKPASPHWYTADTLGDLIASHLANGHGALPLRDFKKKKSVRFLSGFRRVSVGFPSGIFQGSKLDFGLKETLIYSRFPRQKDVSLFSAPVRRWK